ncbi:MAG TPA: AAA family ATPase [Blastocatellia bacterium]|nr:AAA family ATPase [Blastocatellia bacterium]
MLTRLTIRNFRRFDYVDIELGSPVVLIGPNNSGKTAALQALFDRLISELQPPPGLRERMWSRREFENYLCQPETLEAYAEAIDDRGPLFGQATRAIMTECIEDLVPRAALRDRNHRWWHDTKVSDDFLDPLFESFFQKLGLRNLMRKTDYHVLVRHVSADQIAPEISEVLDIVVEVARQAKPLEE